LIRLSFVRLSGFIRDLNLNHKTIKRYIDFTIFAAIGCIFSALVTGVYEIKYENDKSALQSFIKENKSLEVMDISLFSDMIFITKTLYPQMDNITYFEEFKFGIDTSKAQLSNISFGFSRLVQHQEYLLSIINKDKPDYTLIKSNIDNLSKIRKKIKAYNIILLQENLDFKTYFEKYFHIGDDINEMLEDTLSIAQKTMSISQKRVVRNETIINKLNNVLENYASITSNLFFYTFLIQLFCFFIFQLIEIFSEHRRYRI
jgi:hypothetical protein